jgi:hypothetical protein
MWDTESNLQMPLLLSEFTWSFALIFAKIHAIIRSNSERH